MSCHSRNTALSNPQQPKLPVLQLLVIVLVLLIGLAALMLWALSLFVVICTDISLVIVGYAVSRIVPKWLC